VTMQSTSSLKFHSRVIPRVLPFALLLVSAIALPTDTLAQELVAGVSNTSSLPQLT
jgi:hypothetical protein